MPEQKDIITIFLFPLSILIVKLSNYFFAKARQKESLPSIIEHSMRVFLLIWLRQGPLDDGQGNAVHKVFDCRAGNRFNPFDFRIKEGIVEFAKYFYNKN